MQMRSMVQINAKEIVRRALKLVVIEVVGLALASVQVFAGQQSAPQVQPGPESPAQLQQLVAPIALYPDELIAQILAASTYPSEIVEADRWMQQHETLQSEPLATEVDSQSWDPSVKALTAFPSVLSNMDKNISWTSALGSAYFNQQQDVFDAVQTMRQQAEDAGNLRSTPQQTVTSEGPTIVIEPTNPETCYLPVYDPWLVYGSPLDVYPGYVYDPWYGPPYLAFGAGIGIGFFDRFVWGWPAWRTRWDRHAVFFNRMPYVSHSRAFVNGFGGGGFRGGFRSGPVFRSNGGSRTFRGFGQSRAQFGGRAAFGGFRSHSTGGGTRSFGGGARSFGGGARSFHGSGSRGSRGGRSGGGGGGGRHR